MPKIRIDETRTSAGVTISAEPIVVDTDFDMALEPANAIAKGIADAIRGITQTSRDGKHQAFNKTGRLVSEIVAVLGMNGYDIVAPPGYLQSDELLVKLIALVPAISDPTMLDALRTAVEKVASDMLSVG